MAINATAIREHRARAKQQGFKPLTIGQFFKLAVKILTA
jgi:hypothetical protein